VPRETERDRALRELLQAVRRTLDSWRDGWIEEEDTDNLYQLSDAFDTFERAELVASVRGEDRR